MSIATAVTTMDWRGWLRGLIGAAISGGASAIATGLVVPVMDPDHWSFQAGKLYGLVATVFCVSAVVSIAKFLQASPLPGEKTTEMLRVTTTPSGTQQTTAVKITEQAPPSAN